MIFLTVGTQFPFDRLVEAVDKAKKNNLINEEIFAQIGNGSYRPHNFEYVCFLEKQIFDERLQCASSVISHAGTGIITMALDNRKPLLVMPRLQKYGEVVNNHQVDIARKFEQLKYILAAYEVRELPEQIRRLKTFLPCKRDTQSQSVAERIAQFLVEVSSKNSAG